MCNCTFGDELCFARLSKELLPAMWGWMCPPTGLHTRSKYCRVLVLDLAIFKLTYFEVISLFSLIQMTAECLLVNMEAVSFTLTNTKSHSVTILHLHNRFSELAGQRYWPSWHGLPESQHRLVYDGFISYGGATSFRLGQPRILCRIQFHSSGSSPICGCCEYDSG